MNKNPQSKILSCFHKELLKSTYLDEITTKKVLEEILHHVSGKKVKELIALMIKDNTNLIKQYNILLSEKERLQKSKKQSIINSISRDMDIFLNKKNDSITLLYGIVSFLQQIIHHNIAIYESIVRLSKKISDPKEYKIFRLHLDDIYENDEKLLSLAYELE